MQPKLDTGTQYPCLDRFEAYARTEAGFIVPSFLRQRAQFGPEWEAGFDELLRVFVAPSDDRLKEAVRGYAEFAIDGMRLQKTFEKTRTYEEKTYDQAGAEVYHNKQYMFERYLPGILLSHYLWPHHYRQTQFFEREFLPLLAAQPEGEFLDVGPGTGFYTRRILQALPLMRGTAFDISEHALEYCRMHIESFAAIDRWDPRIHNIITQEPERTYPFVVSIEVLEHLTDPLSFLKALRRHTADGGYAYISAAMNAAERDHIYLYEQSEQVADQIRDAGFKILNWQEDRAYEPRADEPVPADVAFVVTTS